MKTLIIRTDKLGDFYVSLPYVKTIVDNLGKDNIDIVISENIFDHYQKKKYLFDNLYSFPKSGILKKILLIIKLKKKKYSNIIIFDGKDRSIIFSLFLSSVNKIIFLEKRKINFLLKLLFKFSKGNYKFVIDDKIKSYNLLYMDILNILKLKINNKYYQYLVHKNLNELEIYKHIINNKDYTLIHLDEKWFSELYIKSLSKIDPNQNQFINFINNLLNAKKNNLFITTGLIKIEFVENLIKSFFTKVCENLYVYECNECKVYLYTKSSIEDLELLTMNSNRLITCNGPLTQVAISFGIPVIDILEKSLESWYDRHIHNKDNYIKLYRKPFENLSKEIINVTK